MEIIKFNDRKWKFYRMWCVQNVCFHNFQNSNHNSNLVGGSRLFKDLRMIFYSIGHYSVECLTITSTRKIWDKTNQHIHNFVKFLITSKANLSIKFSYPFRGEKIWSTWLWVPKNQCYTTSIHDLLSWDQARLIWLPIWMNRGKNLMIHLSANRQYNHNLIKILDHDFLAFTSCMLLLSMRTISASTGD